jgi:hypothetical protein
MPSSITDTSFGDSGGGFPSGSGETDDQPLRNRVTPVARDYSPI